MAFKSLGYATSTPCSSCGSREIEIIESRATKQGTRRRKQCLACHHRFTTYEVSSAWFRQAQDDARRLALIMETLSIAPRLSALGTPGIPCDSCDHASAGKCALGFPEYATQDAHDCTCFQVATH